MCGRYSLEARPDEIAEAFAAAEVFAFSARYNIAPTQSAPVVRVDQESGSRRVVTIRWGLTSHPDNPRPLINARSETVDRTPSFRSAFRSRRCLVPATGFFEWQKLDRTQSASKRSGRSNRPRSRESECAAGGRYGALEILGGGPRLTLNDTLIDSTQPTRVRDCKSPCRARVQVAPPVGRFRGHGPD